jgi:hypothetical protein
MWELRARFFQNSSTYEVPDRIPSRVAASGLASVTGQRSRFTLR